MSSCCRALCLYVFIEEKTVVSLGSRSSMAQTSSKVILLWPCRAGLVDRRGIDVFLFVLRWGRFKPEHDEALAAFAVNCGETALRRTA